MYLVDGNNESVTPGIAITVGEVRSTVRGWRRKGNTIAFVPTMGNLHAGHLELVLAARERFDRVVVSLFVNPTQFGPNEDFDTYPRTIEEDIGKLSNCGVDLVFTPSVEEMYPQGADDDTVVEVRALGDILEGEFRPGFFTGVATVVHKLFSIVEPDAAFFGEKDYQQLLVIRQMVADLHLKVRIFPVPTCREADGLAMSSRNQYLDEEARERAATLYRALRQAVDEIMVSYGKDCEGIAAAARAKLEEAGFDVDYVTLRRQQDLASARASDRALVLLAAARLGSTRLIDNIPFELPENIEDSPRDSQGVA